MTVPVVGVLLMFSLMIGPAATARSFTHSPLRAIVLSVVIALAIVWFGIAIAYITNYPVGFFVGTLGAVAYGCGRGWSAWRRTRTVALAA
jgi:zinc/manganese transport system permease protein